MPVENLTNLADVIASEQKTVLADWRRQVRELPSAKHLDTPTLNDHIPAFLDELAVAFRRALGASISDQLIEATPPEHGRQRFVDGFDIGEVVAEYNILRGCIHDLAERHGLGLFGRAFHILNRVFDGAIGLAVQTFAARQALEVQRRREEYLAFVAHDLRTPLNAIGLSAKVLELKFIRPETDPASVKLLKSLQRNVRQISTLVDKVLKESTHVQTGGGTKPERRGTRFVVPGRRPHPRPSTGGGNVEHAPRERRTRGLKSVRQRRHADPDFPKPHRQRHQIHAPR